MHAKTVLITGKGRSGTTWLAQILNTYVHCSYKHEPFLPGKRTAYRRWMDDLQHGDPMRLRERFTALTRRCVHGVDQPPFPPKSVRPQDPRILHALYGLGRTLPSLAFLYEWYGRPHMHEDADVLIKDVNFPNELLPRLCEVVQPWLVPVVRNPFANIASYLEGVRLGTFAPHGPADVARVRALVDASGDPTLLEHRECLASLSVAAFEAIRWRLQVEPLVAFAHRYPRSHLVVYERLCADPQGETQAIFDFLGWRMKDSTRAFIDASIAGPRPERSAERAYYTVFRDPRESTTKWRTRLTPEQRADIAAIVDRSPCRDLWPDLPRPTPADLQTAN